MATGNASTFAPSNLERRLDPDRPCRVPGCRFESACSLLGPYYGLCYWHRILVARLRPYPGLLSTVESVRADVTGEQRAA